MQSIADSVPGPESFCCAGCETAYGAIRELGLEDFYSMARDGAQPIPRIPTAWDHLDADREAAVSTLSLYLEGVHCAACVWLLEKLPERIDGLHELRIDFGASTAKLIVDTRRVKLSRIAAILDRLGYKPHLLEGGTRSEIARSESRRSLARIGVAGFSAMNCMMLAVSLYQGEYSHMEDRYREYFSWLSLALASPAVLWSARPLFTQAIGAARMRALNIDLPICVAVASAYSYSVLNTVLGREPIYYDSVSALVFLVLAGRYVHRRATDEAIRRSRGVGRVLPVSARLVRGSDERLVSAPSLASGDTVAVPAGERFPADGLITAGETSVDCSVLTGESVPVPASIGTKVSAGCLNLESEIHMRVEATGASTRIGRILDELERGSNDAPIVEMAARVSRIFVGAVFVLSLLSLVAWWDAGTSRAFEVAISVLVITCPCALALATPIALGVAISRAAASGILIKRAEAIERLSGIRRLYVDKTGTLTSGEMLLRETAVREGEDELEALSVAKELEAAFPTHPIARAISRDTRPSRRKMLEGITVSPGRGITGRDASGSEWRIGRLTADGARSLGMCVSDGATLIGLERDSRVIAGFALEDRLRPGSVSAIAELERMGIECVILSGDAREPVSRAARELGLPQVRALSELSPEEKAAIVAGSTVPCAMVGDGVNDAPALRAASAGIGVRSPAEVSLEVSDVFLTSGGIAGVVSCIRGSRRALRVVKGNLILSLLYNTIGGTAAVLGLVDPLVAAIVMPLSSLTVISSSIARRTF